MRALPVGHEKDWRVAQEHAILRDGALHGGADRAKVEDGQPRIADVVDVPRRQRLGKLNMTIPLTDPLTFMTFTAMTPQLYAGS